MTFEEFVARWERQPGVELHGHLGCCAWLQVAATAQDVAGVVAEARAQGFGVEELPYGGAIIEEFG